MHEMSIIQSVVDIVGQEMSAHGVTRLHSVVFRHGAMTNIMPEALTFAWEALTMGTPLEGSTLIAEEIPLVLRCAACKVEFTPEDKGVVVACPACGEELGHEILSGREMYIERMDAE